MCHREALFVSHRRAVVGLRLGDVMRGPDIEAERIRKCSGSAYDSSSSPSSASRCNRGSHN
jgi:hypothetical protein